MNTPATTIANITIANRTLDVMDYGSFVQLTEGKNFGTSWKLVKQTRYATVDAAMAAYAKKVK